MSKTIISDTNLADILGVSVRTVESWIEKAKYPSHQNEKGRSCFYMQDLVTIPEVRQMLETHWDEEAHVTPLRDFTSVELLAGAGGLALGMHLAGFRHVLLNEMDAMAC